MIVELRAECGSDRTRQFSKYQERLSRVAFIHVVASASNAAHVRINQARNRMSLSGEFGACQFRPGDVAPVRAPPMILSRRLANDGVNSSIARPRNLYGHPATMTRLLPAWPTTTPQPDFDGHSTYGRCRHFSKTYFG